MSIVNHIKIVGHVCHDRTSKGYILGGTASYTALMAAKLVPHVTLCTSFGDDFLFRERFENSGVKIQLVPADQTTVFENIYTETGRIQYLHQKASDLILGNEDSIPSDITLLCPIANEIRMSELEKINVGSMQAATIQGWLRSFREDGRVLEKIPDKNNFLGLDVVIFSEEDIKGIPELTEELTKIVPVIVLTKGENGADVFYDKKRSHFPSFQTNAVEVTGAGDIFSICFLYAYKNHSDFAQAMSFAHSAASLSIEGRGTDSIPSYQNILRRQEIYIKLYL